MQEIYYYYRDCSKRPIVTNCLIVADGGRVSKGVAVCAALDVPCKKVGRAIAKTRATFAMKEGEQREFKRGEALDQISCCGNYSHYYLHWSKLVKYARDPVLTEFESRLLRRLLGGIGKPKIKEGN